MDVHSTACDNEVLSLVEENALCFLRQAVAEMRAAHAGADLAVLERAVEAEGGSRVRSVAGGNSAVFALNGARFSIRVAASPQERVEVSFLGGDPC